MNHKYPEATKLEAAQSHCQRSGKGLCTLLGSQCCRVWGSTTFWSPNSRGIATVSSSFQHEPVPSTELHMSPTQPSPGLSGPIQRRLERFLRDWACSSVVNQMYITVKALGYDDKRAIWAICQHLGGTLIHLFLFLFYSYLCLLSSHSWETPCPAS